MPTVITGTDGINQVQAGAVEVGDIDPSAIVGTVSESGGVPTGAIIERGSNANGEYVKYADGTMICTFYNQSAAPNPVTWNFPAIFSVAAIGISATAQSASPRCISSGARSTSSIAISRFDDAGVDKTSFLLLTAIGRWY